MHLLGFITYQKQEDSKNGKNMFNSKKERKGYSRNILITGEKVNFIWLRLHYRIGYKTRK